MQAAPNVFIDEWKKCTDESEEMILSNMPD